jgi:hypothetical protein
MLFADCSSERDLDALAVQIFISDRVKRNVPGSSPVLD